MKTKLDTSGFFDPVKVNARELELSLSADSVRLTKGGIEFFSPKAIEKWTELSLELQSPKQKGRVRCNGIVVDCSGNKHHRYIITIAFTGVSPDHERLAEMIQDQPML